MKIWQNTYLRDHNTSRNIVEFQFGKIIKKCCIVWLNSIRQNHQEVLHSMVEFQFDKITKKYCICLNFKSAKSPKKCCIWLNFNSAKSPKVLYMVDFQFVKIDKRSCICLNFSSTKSSKVLYTVEFQFGKIIKKCCIWLNFSCTKSSKSAAYGWISIRQNHKKKKKKKTCCISQRRNDSVLRDFMISLHYDTFILITILALAFFVQGFHALVHFTKPWPFMENFMLLTHSILISN